MIWYLFLILAITTLFFLWFGYYTNKKVYILYSCVLGMIFGVSIMASGIEVPAGNSIDGNFDQNSILNVFLPDQNGLSGYCLKTDSNNVYWDINCSGGDINGAGVLSVTATSPIFSSGGLNPNITIQKADETHDGYLDSGDYNIFYNTHGLPTGGTTGQALIKLGNEDYNTIWSTISNTAIELTVSELNEKITDSELISEQWYLITDYQTTDYIRQSSPLEYYTAPIEQIYVQASSYNTIKYTGWSKTYPGERIGYLASRSDYFEYPTIEYNPDDGSSGTVEVSATDINTIEIIDNPFASNPNDENSFEIDVFDRSYSLNFTFDNLNKNIDWEFDGNNFKLLDNNYDYNSSFDMCWAYEADGGCSQEINVISESKIEAVDPLNTMSNWIFDSTGGYWYIYDSVSGAYNYYDVGNKNVIWEINGSGEFEILDLGSNTSVYISDYETEISLDSEDTFSLLTVSDFYIETGAVNNGTTNMYIEFSDANSINLDYTNYGTLWTASGSTITIIGDSHDLETDVVYMEGTIFGTDQTLLLDLTSSDAVVEAYSSYTTSIQIDLTNADISGSWSFVAEELNGLIINREVLSQGHNINFDFRGTKFRRYLATAPAYVAGAYAKGDVVQASNNIYVKLITDGVTTNPAGSTGYAKWGKLASGAGNKYFMTADTFKFYPNKTDNYSLVPDLTNYVDTDFLAQSGVDLFDFTTFTTIRKSWNIINSTRNYETTGVDCVISNEASANFTLNLNDPISLGAINNSTITNNGVVLGITTFNNSIAILDNVIIGSLTFSTVNNMSNSVAVNWEYMTVDGQIKNVLSSNDSTNISSSYNVVPGSINNTTFRQKWTNNFIPGTIVYGDIGTRFSSNQIYGTLGGTIVTQAFEFNKVYSLFGSATSNGGRFNNVSASTFYDVVKELANTNIGGTTLYNDYYTISGSTFWGTMQGNNLPLVTISGLEVQGNFTQCDQVGAVFQDQLASNFISGNLYNVRFTGRTTLSFNKFNSDFQNTWFGSGTFASPTDNSMTRNFKYNTFNSPVNYVNHISGYVENNIWLGGISNYGSTTSDFNMGAGVAFSYNVIGAGFNGNKINAQFQYNTIDSMFQNNVISHNYTGNTIGSYVIGNTTTGVNTSAIISAGVASNAIPNIGIGVTYPSLLMKGNSNTTGNLVDFKNLAGTQMFIVNNLGQFSIGATAPQGNFNVSQPTLGYGTVSTTAGSNTVAGTSTLFLWTFKIGDTITIGSETKKVLTRTSNLTLTTDTNFANNNTNVTYTVESGVVLIANGNKRVGVNTTYPDRAFEINDTNGNSLRMTYNNNTGSASNYIDFLTSSTGDLNIIPSGGDINLVSRLQVNQDTNLDGNVWFNDTYWEDVYIPLTSIKLKGINDPDFTNWMGNTYSYEFQDNVLASEDEMYFTFQMPHSYKLGTSFKAHLHWTPDSNNTGNAKFILDCDKADIDGNFVNYLSQIDTNATTGFTGLHKVTDANINTTCNNISCIMQCKLSRNSSATTDTYATGVYVHAIDFHIEQNSIGSRQEYTK